MKKIIKPRVVDRTRSNHVPGLTSQGTAIGHLHMGQYIHNHRGEQPYHKLMASLAAARVGHVTNLDTVVGIGFTRDEAEAQDGVDITEVIITMSRSQALALRDELNTKLGDA